MVNFVANSDLPELTTLNNNKALIRIIPNIEASIQLHLSMHKIYELYVHESKFLANCYSTKFQYLCFNDLLMCIMSCNYL